MSKPIAAVILEGTVVDQFDDDTMRLGNFKPKAVEALRELQRTHFILIVSAMAKTDKGARTLQTLLYQESVPFDEVWMGWGFPKHDVLYANGAQKLGE